ncbi:hypothetical protein KJ765_05530 [Candidatus Micrarchaeota archaeon]|nr:hypothetical protein [Candidatus Micrarchaeota archaeon]
MGIYVHASELFLNAGQRPTPYSFQVSDDRVLMQGFEPINENNIASRSPEGVSDRKSRTELPEALTRFPGNR